MDDAPWRSARDEKNIMQSIYGKSNKSMKSGVEVALPMNAYPAEHGELGVSLLMLALTLFRIDCAHVPALTLLHSSQQVIYT
jgi:hypothetical protein